MPTSEHLGHFGLSTRGGGIESTVLKPAGLDLSKGVLSTFYHKDPTNPAWKDDPALKKWGAFMDQYFPEGDKTSTFTSYAYAVAQAMAHVLRQCGDDLTRENVMRQAANLKNVKVPMLLPGITISTSPSDFAPIEAVQPARFDGTKWVPFGGVLGQ